MSCKECGMHAEKASRYWASKLKAEEQLKKAQGEFAEVWAERNGWKQRAEAATIDRLQAEVMRLTGVLEDTNKVLESTRLAYRQCHTRESKLRAVVEAHRRFHDKVPCPGEGTGCYVCDAEAALDREDK